MTDVAALGFAIDSSQAVKATGDLDKLTASATKVQGAQKLVGTEAQKMAAQFGTVSTQTKQLGTEHERVYAALSTRSYFRLLAREASLLGGPLGSAISQFGLLNVGGQRLGVGLTVSTIAVGGLVAGMVKLVGILKDAAAISQSAQFSNIGGQGIQGLTAAGGFKGIGQEDVLKAMVELNKQVELAKLGLGSLSALFRANGVAVTTTEEAFFRIADLVKNARNEAEKFSIIQQAGLPATNEMVRLLQQGADAIRRQSSEAGKLTNAQLAQAERINDKWNEVWTNFERNAKLAVLNTVNFLRIEFHPERIFTGGGIFEMPGKLANAGKADIAALPSEQQRITITPNTTINPEQEKLLLEQEKQRITVLGQTASVIKEVRLAEIDLRIAQINNVGPTKAQRDSLIELARERALGITGIKAQIDSTNVQAATMFMGAGATAEYTAKQNLFNEAVRNHKVLTDEDRAAIAAQAKVLGDAVSAAHHMKDALDQTQTFASGFFTDLSHGVTVVDSLRNATTKLSDALIKMASDKLIANAFGALVGGLGGAGGIANSAKSAYGFHSGGIVGSGEHSFTRMVDPMYFANAPRYHSGGMVGEYPLIGKGGEGVFTPGQMRALAPVGSSGSGPPVEVHIHEAPPGTNTKTTRAANGNMRVDVTLKRMIDDATADHIASGESNTNKAFERRYGATPKL